MVEGVGTVVGRIDIDEAVVIDVSHRHPRAVARVAQPRFLRDVGEGAVRVLPVETIGNLAGLLRFRKGASLDQVNVQIAVVVVIEKRPARAHDLGRQILSLVAGIVNKVEPHLAGDLGEEWQILTRQ